MLNDRRNLRIFVAIAVLLGVAANAPAQYRYRYPRPGYGNTVYAPYAGAGGVAAGQAQLVNAQGNYLKSQEDARVGREKAYQEYLNSKKQTVELNKYIESNTPTYGEKQEKIKGMRTRRILNDPSKDEIISGEALNVMTEFIRSMSNQGVQGAPIFLDQKVLGQINVITPTTGKNVGMLTRTLEWPISLRGEKLQKELAVSIPKSVNSAIAGTLDFKTYTKVRKDVTKLRDETKDKYYKGTLDAGSYLIADDFLQKLQLSVYELQKPGNKTALKGTNKARGRTVQELAMNMGREGLKFAPAAPGSESAYYSLCNSLKSYTVRSHHSFGFQLGSVEPRKNFKYPTQ